jgi:DNA-binding MarR family transcriptional regulator
MSKKSEFINYVRNLQKVAGDEILMSEEAQTYWAALCGGSDVAKTTFTDNGKLIMQYLQSLPAGTPMMKAKEIADGMFISSRAVSGAMRKLVTDGFVEKVGQDPVMYALTDAGRKINIEE